MLMREAHGLLQPVRKGLVTLYGATGALETAAGLIADCRKLMADLAKNPFPSDFQNMRNHLVTLTIGETEYEPPNATYLPGWNLVDIAVGNHHGKLADAIKERTKHMPHTDADAVRVDKLLPSIPDILDKTVWAAKLGRRS